MYMISKKQEFGLELRLRDGQLEQIGAELERTSAELARRQKTEAPSANAATQTDIKVQFLKFRFNLNIFYVCVRNFYFLTSTCPIFLFF